MVSLLEFISVFAESHLERCVSMSALSQGGGNNALNPSSGSVDVNMNQAVVGFFEELVATTTGTQEPEILSRIVTVWNRVLYMGSVKDSLLTQSSLCVNMVSHLLQCCLCSSNSNMHDSVEELIEDMTIDPLVDPHIRSILSHICDYPRTNTTTSNTANNNNNNNSSNSHNATAVLSAEEVNFIGSVLLRDCTTLFTELVASIDVQQWLTNSVNQLQSQHVAILSSPTSANHSSSAVDLHFLTSLLPLLQVPLPQIIAQLATLAAQLSESQLYNRGKEFAVLIVSCCQMAGRLIQCNGIITVNRVDAQLVNELHHVLCTVLLPCLSHLTGSVCNNNSATSAITSTTTTYTTTVYTSVCVLLLQTVTINIDVLDMDNAQCASIKTTLVTLLQDPHSGETNYRI